MPTPHTLSGYLLQQYATYYFIKKERFELLDWIYNQNNDTGLQNKMESVWQNTAVDYVVFGIYREKDFCQILNRIIPPEESKSNRFVEYRKIAAALISILTNAGIVYLNADKKNEKPPIATITSKKDLPPRKSRTALTLSTGRKIIFYSAGNETLVRYAKVNFIIKKIGNAGQPFIVHVKTTWLNGVVIENISTSFSINARNNEPVVKNILIEGEVKYTIAA